MKIALFTDAFIPQINGVVSYVVDIATLLSSRGHTVVVFVPKPRRNYKIDHSSFSFEIKLLPSIPSAIYPDVRITIPSLIRVLRFLRKFRPDVIHINDPWTVCIDGVQAAKILNIPIIMTYHTFYLDDDILKNVHFGSLIAKLRAPLSRIISYFYNYADVVICPSKAAETELKKYGLKKPIVIIPNGVDLNKIKRLSRLEVVQKRLTYGILAQDKTGIFVGRLAPDKSIDELIRAWHIICKFQPTAKLLIIGEGKQKKYLKKLVSDIGLDNNVIFTGSIDRDEILSTGLYSIADIFVTASKIENQSIAMLEALASGLPVVAVNMRGSAELVQSSNGILVAPGQIKRFAQAVLSIITNEEMQKSLNQGSLHLSKKFDIENIIQHIEEIYSSVSNKNL